MASVQFNLLPDLKMNTVKANRNRSVVVKIAVIVTLISVGLVALLFASVNIVQKKQMGDADKDIARLTEELKAIPNIENILTIQNQLKSLSSLHQSKHVASRIFGYLPQVTPANTTISSINLDLSTNTMTISGTAASQLAVNTFVDTLKFTKYKVGEGGQENTAFPTVTESSFALSSQGASYSLSVSFDPNLFANNLKDDSGATQAPTLVVPKLTTTHATSGDPNDVLFEEPAE